MDLNWIIDLLINKIKKDKNKEFEPEPIWIDNLDEFDPGELEKDKKEKKSNDIIVIDL